jgi:hypothetical protein
MASSRNSSGHPTLPRIIGTHRQLRIALSDAQSGRDVPVILAALSEPHSEDADGLNALLAGLGARTPGDLLEIIRMLTLSAGYTALTWAGGLTTGEGNRVNERDVMSTSWAAVQWEESDLPDDLADGEPSNASDLERQLSGS